MAKSRSREAGKAPQGQGAKKTKTAVCLSEGAIKRLGAACVYHDADQSELVEWMINEYLSGYVLQMRGKPISFNSASEDQPRMSVPVIAEESANGADHVNHSALSRL